MFRTPALARVVRVFRPFSTSTPRLFLENWLGTKEAKKREIIEKQDDYEVNASKIVILNQQNSPNFKPFVAEEDMPDYKVNEWKFSHVRVPDIEATYTKEKLALVMSETYQELKGEHVTPEQYAQTPLTDLQFRFQFGKLLQQKLGFDVKDHTLSRSHDLGYLYDQLSVIIALRWSNERNPNAIVLRPEDFNLVLNVYLSSERNEKEKEQAFEELVEKARAAST